MVTIPVDNLPAPPEIYQKRGPDNYIFFIIYIEYSWISLDS